MKKWGLLIAVILMIVLRVVALRSDSYVRLDWSAGQLTDEGFYIHNARNVILFGHAQTDDFNNMLLAPLLHYFQVFWFEIFGVGAVQARMISVLCSLLSLWLFWKALRRIFGVKIALVGALFLGFDHTYLLFNRMALMDTPAALAAIASFYFFVLGVTERNRWWRAICFFVSGVMLGVLLGIRSLCAWLIPAPVAALWAGSRKKEVIALSVGFILAMSVWVVFWYLPHFAEMTMMANYYRKNQLQPHTWARFGANIWVGFMGDFRGIAPYVFRHTPVLLTLAILALFFGRIALKDIKQDCADWSARKIVFIYLCCWFVFSWTTFVIICYAPGRYYVPIYPAIALSLP
jgi:4-amino-4-deoxy-L-arabinose transferase-like glycosyltransferase